MGKNDDLETSSANSIEQIDAEILKLQRRRNSLIPIARLPPEILTIIFLLNVLDGKSDFDYRFIFDSFMPVPWMTVTFVCHHWRVVALNSSRLWSFWGYAPSQWLEAFASRSKAAPLHIRLSYPPPILPLFFEDPDIRERIQELHLNGDTSWMGPCLRYFDNYDDSIERPSIIRSLRLCSHADSYDIHSMKLPKPFHNRESPHLRQLELEGFEFDWNSPIFTSSNLVFLTIHQDQGSNLPALTHILSILEKQPRLEILDLQLDRTPIPNAGVSSHVQLPRLRKLVLSGSLSYCFDLAAHLSYPRTSTVITFSVPLELENPPITSVDSYADLESRISPFISRHYGCQETESSSVEGEAPLLRHLSLNAINTSCVVDCWDHVQSDQPPSLPSFSCHFDLEQQWTDEPSVGIPAVTRALCATLPLTHLRKLDVVGIAMTTEGWLDIFNPLDNLEELMVIETVMGIITALKPHGQANTSDGGRTGAHHSASIEAANDNKLTLTRGGKRRPKVTFQSDKDPSLHVPLPSLRRLLLHIVDFHPTGISVSDLCSCLEARKQAHSELDLLSFRLCRHLSQSDIETYKEKSVAAVVDWDGEEELDDLGPSLDAYSDSDEDFDDEYNYYAIFCEYLRKCPR